jgi:hypothetical protein
MFYLNLPRNCTFKNRRLIVHCNNEIKTFFPEDFLRKKGAEDVDEEE